MSRIVSLGSAVEDIYLIDRDDLSVVDWNGQSIFSGLSFGATVDIDKAEYHVGGSGINAAVTFARYGHETIFMGNIARDIGGEAVLRCLDEENIDSSYAEITTGTTATRVLLVDARTGARTELKFEGVAKTMKNLDPKDLEDIEPDWIYLAGIGGDMHKILALIEKAHKLGTKIMWNPGVAELKHTKKVLGLLSDVDVLLVNKIEAAKLVPGVILTELLARLSNYCKTVIITDGIMGAIATDHSETYRLGVYEQNKVKDINGAGDAFGAGFLARFADSGDFAEALKYASANAAKVTEKFGARAGIMSGAEKLHQMPMVKIANLSEWSIS